jgi:hypothetical protein
MKEAIKHPAFGKIRAARVSGHSNLFMVDYPQSHYIELTISKADLRREHSNDWVHGDEQLITVAMSEVQWARMLSSLNTEGVPCTLERYYEPTAETFVRPAMPDNHVGKADTFTKEVQETAKLAGDKLTAVITMVTEVLSGAGAIKKGDIKEILSMLNNAKMQLASNLPFVVQQAEEAIETAVESGKSEIDAHIDFAMLKLGERALGDKVQDVLLSTEAKRALGNTVLDALTDQTERNK